MYVLRCIGDRYYVGKSTEHGVQKRITAHWERTAKCAWTSRYPVVEEIYLKHGWSPFAEDALTLEYMRKYGIDKVRGGTYANVVLSNLQLKQIEMATRGALDLCLRCGKGGHFISECPDEAVVTAAPRKSAVVVTEDMKTAVTAAASHAQQLKEIWDVLGLSVTKEDAWQLLDRRVTKKQRVLDAPPPRNGCALLLHEDGMLCTVQVVGDETQQQLLEREQSAVSVQNLNREHSDLDTYTLQQMAAQGFENVRGGKFISSKLSHDQINEFICSIKDTVEQNCFRCGASEHCMAKCPFNKIQTTCTRCQKWGHQAVTCSMQAGTSTPWLQFYFKARN